MAGFAGAAAAGLTSNSILQQSLTAAAEVESVMGRRPSATPSHLTRILYIPRHTSLTTHLPIYDVSEQYRRAEVGSALMGSSLFTIRLGLMKPPREDGTDRADVQYLVDFTTASSTTEEGSTTTVVGKIQQRVLGGAGSEVEVVLPPFSGLGSRGEGGEELQGDGEGEFMVKVVGATNSNSNSNSNNPFRKRVNNSIPVRTTFPIPDSVTKAGMSRNPYFRFNIPSGNGRALQWEIHPVEHGPLRYTLVSSPSPSSTSGDGGADDGEEKREKTAGEAGGEVQAIYHHMGLGTSLSTVQHSEGVLLLPPPPQGKQSEPQSVQEGLVVASLLGLLWRVREMGELQQKQAGRRRTSESGKGGGGRRKNSLFGLMLRKRSTG